MMTFKDVSMNGTLHVIPSMVEDGSKEDTTETSIKVLNDESEKKIVELNKKIDELSNKNDELMKENDDCKDKVDNLQKKTDEAEKSNDDLEKKVDELEKSNDDLEKKNEELEKSTDDLEKTVDKLEKEIEELKSVKDSTSIAISGGCAAVPGGTKVMKCFPLNIYKVCYKCYIVRFCCMRTRSLNITRLQLIKNTLLSKRSWMNLKNVGLVMNCFMQ